MIPLPYKILFIAAGAILAGAGGYIAGYSKATDKYAPEIANLEASIEMGNHLVENEQIKREDALNENRKVAEDLYGRVAADRDSRVARVRDLQAKNTALAAIASTGSKGDISESCESRFDRYATGQEIKYTELEGRCITDAAARVVIKDWAERIGLKPAK